MTLHERTPELELIERYGWMVQYVYDHLPWAYTVGLAFEFGHPELTVVGLGPEHSRSVLNVLAHRVRSGTRLHPGSLHAGGIELRIGDVHAAYWATSWFNVWKAVAPTLDPEEAILPNALQVIWPDAEGRFPDATDFDPNLRRWQRCLAEPPSRSIRRAETARSCR